MFNTLGNRFGLNFVPRGVINEHPADRFGPKSPFMDISLTDRSQFLRHRVDAAKITWAVSNIATSKERCWIPISRMETRRGKLSLLMKKCV